MAPPSPTSSSSSSHGKAPTPPYKKALAALRCYPRLEAAHVDLRRLTRKDVMALVDRVGDIGVLLGHACLSSRFFLSYLYMYDRVRGTVRFGLAYIWIG